MAEKKPSRTDILGLASFGFFLVLLGAIFATTPGLGTKVVDFFQDFRRAEVYSGVWFFAPTSNHPAVYNAVYQFCLVFGTFQIILLATRFIIRDSANRKAEILTGIIFWFGAAFAMNSLAAGSLDWFVFLGWIVVLVGISITLRSAVAFASRRKG